MPKITGDTLEIKLVTDPGERDYYSDLLTRHHYLCSSAINRNSIVHVARMGRRDVAVLTWEPKVGHRFDLRDRLIGWAREQKEQRLKYCVQNRRFLMLEEGKNLASQVLSLSCKRLDRDGQEMFGHEFLLAETFVDPSRGYEGTCYKAAGWTDIGLTAGGRGTDTRSRKQYFVKELQADGLAKLKAANFSAPDLKRPKGTVLALDKLNLLGLKRALDSVPDYRKHKGWYPLTSIFALIVAAVLGGATSVSAIHRWTQGLSLELLKSLGCRKHPSYSMFWRTLHETDQGLLSEALCAWLSEQITRIHVDRNIRVLSLDGKTLRGAAAGGAVESHIVSLVDSIAKSLTAQIKVEAKSNEIPAAQKLLAAAPLDANTIVTADAMHTQKTTAEIIQKKTLTTSSRSKTIKRTLVKQSLKRPRKKAGRYATALKALGMDA